MGLSVESAQRFPLALKLRVIKADVCLLPRDFSGKNKLFSEQGDLSGVPI